MLKANRIYGLSQKGDLFCVDAQEGKTLWTAPFGAKDFGSVVDAGPVLMALGPQGELAVFEPSEKEFKKLASYKVAENTIYAHPALANKGIYQYFAQCMLYLILRWLSEPVVNNSR